MIIWHTKNLTTNQKKALQYKKRTYYGEVGRKVDWVKRRKLQNMIIPSSNKSPVKQQQNYSVSKQKDSYNKKVWYLDKAAPIPGVNPKLSVGYARKNKSPKKAFNAYRMFKNYSQIRSKKTLSRFFSTAYHAVVHSSNNQMTRMNSREFTALVYFDSLYHSSLRKRAFKVKPQGHLLGAKQMHYSKSAALVYAPERNQKNILLNGKYVRKGFHLVCSSRVRFQKGGDFSIVVGPNNILKWARSKTTKVRK